MSIRLKVLGAIMTTFAILLLSVYVVAREILQERFTAVEQPIVEDSVRRTINALSEQAGSLASIAIDYAWWDDTYTFAQDPTSGYIETNFGDPAQVLGNLNATFVVITDSNSSPLLTLGYNFEEGRPVEVSEDILAAISQIATSEPFQSGESEVSAAGLYRTSSGLVMVATSTILPTSRTGTSAGTLTFGREIGTAQISALSESLRTQIRLYPADPGALSEPTAAAYARLDDEQQITVEPLDEQTIIGVGILNDVLDEPVALVETTLARDVWQQGQATIQLFSLLLLAAGIVVSAISYVALDRLVVSRIALLSEKVDVIQNTGDLSIRLGVDSDDEIASLSGNINQMVAKLSESQQELRVKNAALEQAVEEVTESARLKTEFLSVMSHELRTPLNAIIGYSGIMLTGVNGELDDEATRMVTNIFDSSKHLLSLVNDILDLSKIDAGRLELVDAPYAIRELIHQLDEQIGVLAKQKNLTFTKEIAPDVPEWLMGDRERIKQVLINLLSNAIKFTEQGSVVLRIERAGDELELSVTDTGIGIPAHALDYIFDDFRQVDASTRRTQRGTGLGLSIVRKLTSAMKGRVQVSSEVGVGSTFTVTLPLEEHIAESEPERVADSQLIR